MSDRVSVEIGRLALRYQTLIAHDHHKDRDCHWSIERRWSYGEQSVYFVAHDGYCFEYGERGPFTSCEDAVTELERALKQAITEAEDWAA